MHRTQHTQVTSCTSCRLIAEPNLIYYQNFIYIILKHVCAYPLRCRNLQYIEYIFKLQFHHILDHTIELLTSCKPTLNITSYFLCAARDSPFAAILL
jgi:hypothetical protein